MTNIVIPATGPLDYDIVIQKGKTLSLVLRVEAAPLVYKAITAITKAGPVAITAASHGLTDGWRAAVSSVGGMRQLNSEHFPPQDTDYHKVTKTDANTVGFNDVDSTNYTTYTSGGSLVYPTALSLASCSARMQIRATAAATATLASLVSPTDIVLDDAAKTVTVTITAAVTAAYTFTSGVYDLEFVNAASAVSLLMSGNVTVEAEVTR